MKLIYIKKEDRYIDIESEFYPGVMYTTEDIIKLCNDFDIVYDKDYPYHEHNKSYYTLDKLLKDVSFYHLVEMLPSAKKAMIARLKQKLKLVKENKKRYFEAFYSIKESYREGLDMDQQAELTNDFEEERKKKDEEFKTEEKTYTYQISFLQNQIKKDKAAKLLLKKDKTKKEIQEAKKILTQQNANSNGIQPQEIERAKEVPITNFVKINAARKAKCFMHNERTPSLHVYKNNKFHCFSCGQSGSVIDVIMIQQNIPFVEAVKYLNNI